MWICINNLYQIIWLAWHLDLFSMTRLNEYVGYTHKINRDLMSIMDECRTFVKHKRHVYRQFISSSIMNILDESTTYSLGKFCRWQIDIFLIFLRNRIWHTVNVESRFLEKVRKIFRCVIYWNFCPACWTLLNIIDKWLIDLNKGSGGDRVVQRCRVSYITRRPADISLQSGKACYLCSR